MQISKVGGRDREIFLTNNSWIEYLDGPRMRIEKILDTLAEVVAYIGSDDATLVVERPVAVAADVTLPATCTLDIRDGGSFSVASTKTLTINGILRVNGQKYSTVFGGAGTVTITGGTELLPKDLKFAFGEGLGMATLKVTQVVKAHDSDLFDAADTTDSVNIWLQPANSIFLYGKIVLDVAFVAASLTDLTLEVGDGSDDNGLLTVTGNLVSGSPLDMVDIKGAYVPAGILYSAGTSQYLAYAKATGANLSTTSAGQVTFTFIYLQF